MGLSLAAATREKPLRESLSILPFTRAFLKSPVSRGLSAIAELLVRVKVRVSINMRLFALYFQHRYSVDDATGGYHVCTMNSVFR